VARLAPPVMDFGEQRVGTAGEPRELTVTNGGERPLEITAVTVAGEAAEAFAVLDDGCRGRRLAAGEPCTVRVSFRPSAGGGLGRRSAALEVAGPFANSPESLPLLGAAVAPLASPERHRIELGELPAGGAAGQTTAITNRGTAPLVLGALRLRGAGAEDFQLLSDFCSGRTLAPGERCTLEIGFEPHGEGAREAVLEAPEEGGPGARIELAGVGMAPRPRLVSEVSELDFGEQRLGAGAAAARPVHVTNPGPLPVRVGRARVEAAPGEAGPSTTAPASTPSAVPPFTVSRDLCSGAALAAGEGCGLGVLFQPTAEGAAAARLVVPYTGSETAAGEEGQPAGEAAEGAELILPLAATAVVARLVWVPERLELGRVQVGETARGELRLENRGSGAAAVEGLALSGPDAGAFELSPGGCTGEELAPGEGCSLEVVFRPRREGGLRAELAAPAAGAAGGGARAAVSGSGLAPRLAVSPGRLAWGGVEVGARVDRRLTLSNPGSAPLTLRRLAVEGGADLSLAGGGCAAGVRLAPGRSCEVVVRFAPSAEGRRTASLEVDHDGLEGPRRIDLTATAVPPAVAELDLSPSALFFGDQPVGRRSSIETVTLTNPGAVRVGLGRIALEGAQAKDFQMVAGSCDGLTFLAPGGSCTVGVRCLPTVEGRLGARLVVESDALERRQAVDLSGRGVAAGAP
jgi:hypothetical protein